MIQYSNGRYFETGLLVKFWTELQHGAALTSGGRVREAAADMFFAFSVSHLMPAFVALLVGTILCSVVFVADCIVNCLCKRWKRKRIRTLED